MPLNTETIGWIAELSGLTAEDISAKINSEKEEGIEKPHGEFFSDDDLSKRDSSKYKEGKDAGVEMMVKDLKREYGYEIDGKDVKSFLGHHEDQLKSKYSKAPNERVQELENDIKRQKATYEEEITGYKDQLNDFRGRYEGQLVNNKLLSIMPKETTIKADAIVTLFKSEHQVVDEDGVLVVKRNGETLKDTKTASPLKVDDVFNEYVINEGFAKKQSGRGGGNEYGSSGFRSKTPSEFQSEWENKNPGKSTNSTEYKEAYATWRKDQVAA